MAEFDSSSTHAWRTPVMIGLVNVALLFQRRYFESRQTWSNGTGVSKAPTSAAVTSSQWRS